MQNQSLEQTALNLMCLLNALSAVDTGNNIVLQELPISIKVCAGMADTLYCAIVNKEVSA